MYDRILFATDGSDCAAAAGEHAIDQALRYEAGLTVLSVVDPTALGPDVRASTILDQLEADARERVEAVVERATDRGVGRATGEVVRGTPHRAILDAAGEEDADLIVVGTHGRTGLDRYLLGSVAERVVRTAPVAVLVVPDPDREA